MTDDLTDDLTGTCAHDTAPARTTRRLQPPADLVELEEPVRGDDDPEDDWPATVLTLSRHQVGASRRPGPPGSTRRPPRTVGSAARRTAQPAPLRAAPNGSRADTVAPVPSRRADEPRLRDDPHGLPSRSVAPRDPRRLPARDQGRPARHRRRDGTWLTTVQAARDVLLRNAGPDLRRRERTAGAVADYVKLRRSTWVPDERPRPEIDLRL